MYLGAYFIAKKRNTLLHSRFMIGAISWDLLLVLQIEFSRGAVAKAMKVSTNTLILNFHVSIAILSVLLYAIMVYSGKNIIRGNRSLLKFHRIFGMITLTLRTLVFITSFFVAN
jgi:uncharacterized membrane protein YozB (DUF420 family)